MKKYLSIVLGPLVFIIVNFFCEFNSLSKDGQIVLAATCWIAIWWMTEAIPLAVTSLLPLVLFPIFSFGDISVKDVAQGYSHPLIFLFIGGFILSIAIEKWNLHKRIAVIILNKVGSNLKNIMLGFMIATAFLSMWISNTAATIMMLPVALAVVKDIRLKNKDSKFGKPLMLAIAYSATLGGVSTLIGTPPNIILSGMLEEIYQIQISFVDWMKIALPFSIPLIFVSWKYLGTILGDEKNLSQKNEKIKLSKMSPEEKKVALIFGLTAFGWISQSYILDFIGIKIKSFDTIIALCSAVILFILPSSKNSAKLLTWDDMIKIPWDIILLFGGGLTLAASFANTGLSDWIGNNLIYLKGTHVAIILLIIIALINFLTEITSNSATTSIILPIIAALALAIDMNPILLMCATAMAASCAFMLPVATPPNAIVFGSGELKISEMIRVGIWMNIISILVLLLLMYFIVPIIFGISVTPFSTTF